MIAVALVLGFLYSLPNFFGETPALQISPVSSSIHVDNTDLKKIEAALAQAKLQTQTLKLQANTIRASFQSADDQIRGRDELQKVLGERFTVALTQQSNSPEWLHSIYAKPMYLGLDLRGGVHFMMELDLQAALDKKVESYASDMRRLLREAKVRYGTTRRIGQTVEISLRDEATLKSARKALNTLDNAMVFSERTGSGDFKLVATLNPAEHKKVQEQSIQQNITTLHNRVNELGVAEPIIHQQGERNIVVQLPGVQDPAKAKEILGRTATLEVRMVEDDPQKMKQAMEGMVPPELELLDDTSHDGVDRKILLKRQVELSGENITDAQPGYSGTPGSENEPAVHIRLNSLGASIFKQLTHDNVGKRMAMLLVEKGKAQVVTAPNINSEIGGGQVQISGGFKEQQEAIDIALLLRAGSLAAPMNIVEERTIGPSSGAENISKGFHSTLWGFVLISVFMVIYYRLFGGISVIALAANLLFLIGILSSMQATLTLPGIAAIALALGMAIDSNVLINERIREELAEGANPQQAIQGGYQHAWATILDSNVTTLIAGLALLSVGSGPVKGFAVVHCLGIVTSVFSSVLVSRGLVNLIHGGRKLKSLSV